MKALIPLHDMVEDLTLLCMYYRGNIFSKFSGNSESNASEILKNS